MGMAMNRHHHQRDWFGIAEETHLWVWRAQGFGLHTGQEGRRAEHGPPGSLLPDWTQHDHGLMLPCLSHQAGLDPLKIWAKMNSSFLTLHFVIA